MRTPPGRRLIGAVITLCTLLLRIADADDAKPSSTNERDVGPYVLVGALAANTAFTIYNLATIGHAKPKLYGFGEALLTAPQALVFSSLAAMIDDDDGDAWIPASIAIWTGVLATHGIYTLARSDESSARSSPRVIMFSFDTRF